MPPSEAVIPKGVKSMPHRRACPTRSRRRSSESSGHRRRGGAGSVRGSSAARAGVEVVALQPGRCGGSAGHGARSRVEKWDFRPTRAARWSPSSASQPPGRAGRRANPARCAAGSAGRCKHHRSGRSRLERSEPHPGASQRACTTAAMASGRVMRPQWPTPSRSTRREPGRWQVEAGYTMRSGSAATVVM